VLCGLKSLYLCPPVCKKIIDININKIKNDLVTPYAIGEEATKF